MVEITTTFESLELDQNRTTTGNELISVILIIFSTAYMTFHQMCMTNSVYFKLTWHVLLYFNHGNDSLSM